MEEIKFSICSTSVPEYRKLITKSVNFIFLSLISKYLVSCAAHSWLFYRSILYPAITVVRNTAFHLTSFTLTICLNYHLECIWVPEIHLEGKREIAGCYSE